MTSSKEKDSQQPSQEILAIIHEGSRAFSLHDYENATDKFGQACELLDNQFGELAPQCADAYFMYGKALLQNAIQQNSVLGNAAAEDSAAVEDTETLSNPRFHFEGEPDLREVEAEGDDEADDEEGQEDQEEEGESDMFNDAWDVLDIARVIYGKDSSQEARLKLADVYSCLGDVSLETEKFDQAIPDFQSALSIKQSILDEDNRELAELHYKLALAFEYSTSEQHQAIEETRNAVKVLRNRLSTLKEKQLAESGDVKGKGKESNVVIDSGRTSDIQKEIDEIQELIPDMEVKIEELKNPKQLEAQVDMLKEMLGLKGSTGLPAVPIPTNVNDLSSLVKKRKADNSATAPEKEGKQPKNE
ncbi:hypothetical protein K450DRAFT_236358 [Umbelopsis ramanniana AG]|uniref:Tetratricopeptide SHNi-TPR domain-containing protein n=1 Tax=Umbelopsis ramanniana AG TaxID=1314678 RepID=A0AAD5EC49_UMBRA|nr:uncharacterized protein K450DRAFT_236358 [Umbelopsis ramanniana AG]KAI8580587.1 hypothetical protein K450DRAFT_236358 [Umbelopsis ramanniana AG]